MPPDAWAIAATCARDRPVRRACERAGFVGTISLEIGEALMSLQSEADALLQKAVASGDVPGVVAVATDRDGTIYEGGFGERVLGRGESMTPDTVGWIASMTKALTGTAAM